LLEGGKERATALWGLVRESFGTVALLNHYLIPN